MLYFVKQTQRSTACMHSVPPPGKCMKENVFGVRDAQLISGRKKQVTGNLVVEGQPWLHSLVLGEKSGVMLQT